MVPVNLFSLWLATLVTGALQTEGLHKRWLETRGDTQFNVFQRTGDTSSLAYIKNSGICETTPGVDTYSGYLDVDLDTKNSSHMWYWLFGARKEAATAPLVVWLNGGPGCSSMIGLFQENGPCQFAKGSNKPSLNKYSWNEYANMLYVDQPIGSGFSYGNSNVTSTVSAAAYIWKFLQNFYAAFPEYESRDFGIWTESYGGHYVPQFSAYFQAQNAAIDAGKLKGKKVKLVAVGIGNGWIDPLLQYPTLLDFAHNNTYRQLINQSLYEELRTTYTDTCAPLLKNCNTLIGKDKICHDASQTCFDTIDEKISEAADYDVYDITLSQNESSSDPPQTYIDYLSDKKVLAAIGAVSKYAECGNAPYDKIMGTGDDARSFQEPLAKVLQSGVNVLVYAGDKDAACNWKGSLAVANNLEFAESAKFRADGLHDYKLGGVSKGQFKTAGKLNFMRFFDAGHEVPYYQPKVALQVFIQIMKGGPLKST